MVTRLWKALVAAICTLIVPIAAPSPAAAGHCFDGYLLYGVYSNPIATSGTQANITLYNPPICDPVTSETSNAWVMIQTVGGNRWAQSGYGKLFGCDWPLGCYFAQWVDSAGITHTAYGWQIQSPIPYPANNHFSVFRDGGNLVHMRANGYDWATPQLNWLPRVSTWMSETHTFTDRRVGSATAPVAFFDLQHLYNGTWYSDNPNANNIPQAPPYANYFSWSTNAFYIWDSRN
jgi:hypothetical protein